MAAKLAKKLLTASAAPEQPMMAPAIGPVSMPPPSIGMFCARAIGTENGEKIKVKIPKRQMEATAFFV